MANGSSWMPLRYQTLLKSCVATLITEQDLSDALLLQVGHPTLGIPLVISIWPEPEPGFLDESLTWAEIAERFQGEWVAIADPSVNDDISILGGRVVYHGDSQERAFARLTELGVRDGAVEYIGSATVPGLALIL